jgi:hypothetical protein
MLSGQVVRRLALSGPYSDTDWTDPAVTIPASVRPIRATGETMTFAIVGLDSDDVKAKPVDITGLLVDAYLAREVGDSIERGKTLAEVEGSPIDGRIVFLADDVRPRQTCYLHITLTGTIPAAIGVVLIGGGRRL